MEARSGGKEAASTTIDVRRKLAGPALHVANLLFTLAKTSRSFGFYSRDNRAIQLFLDEVWRQFDIFVREHGALKLGVGADRLTWEGTEVYHDSDRENGLPFKLFRDGVRGLIFKPGIQLSEVEKVLDILARRPSMGRQAEEEDVVTLLWKASLEHVSAQVVEGFTHDLHASGSLDDEGGQKADSGEAIPRMMERISGRRETLTQRARGRVARSYTDAESEEVLDEITAPQSSGGAGETQGSRRHARKTPVRDGGETAAMLAVSEVDLGGVAFKEGLYPGATHYPLPLLGGMAEIRYEAIEEQELVSLRKELDEELAVGILHMFDYCFELLTQGKSAFAVEDFRPMLAPVRRYLVASKDLLTFDRLLRYLRKLADGGPYPAPVPDIARSMLEECCAPEALAAVVAAADGDEERERVAWDILQALLPGLDSAQLLELLGRSMTDRMGGILAGTLIRRTGADLSLFEKALAAPEPWRALAALRCLDLLRTAPAVRLVEQATRWNDPIVRRIAVRVLTRAPSIESTQGTLLRSMKDDDPAVRDEALYGVARQAEASWAPGLSRWFVEEGWKRLDDERRRAIVEILVQIDPAHATMFFVARLQMGLRARMGGIVGTPETVAWNHLAVEGLSLCGTDEAIQKLREVRTSGDEAWREFVNRQLYEARHRAGRGDETQTITTVEED